MKTRNRVTLRGLNTIGLPQVQFSLGWLADDTPGLDKLTAQFTDRGTPLSDLIAQLLPELAKLSPQGNVHVKTLYAAVNLVRRTPPGPLFAALAAQTAFRALGDGYYLAR